MRRVAIFDGVPALFEKRVKGADAEVSVFPEGTGAGPKGAFLPG